MTNARPDTWMQTASGRAFDLLAPTAADIDFAQDVAPVLARLPRFGGHVAAGNYSVAQHCVVGAEALLEETGDPLAALAFLLHDAHEAYVGDMTRPVAAALSWEPGYGDAPGVEHTIVRSQIAHLKARLDAAIHAAAGVPWPLPSTTAIVRVREMDERMLETERRQILTPCARPWAWDAAPPRPVRLRGGIRIWPWPQAAERWMNLLRQWSPAVP